MEYSVDIIDLGGCGQQYKVVSPPQHSQFVWYENGCLEQCLANICERHPFLCRSVPAPAEDVIDIVIHNHPQYKKLYITREIVKEYSGQYQSAMEFITLLLSRQVL
ncbi:MAG: hypothetical protein V1725_01770 [archaeon]